MQTKQTTKKSETRYLWGILLFCVLLFIDQLTKIWADSFFERGEYLPIIEGRIHLCITYNRGIAYGIGRDSSAWLKIAVIAGTAVMMFGLAVAYFKLDDTRKLMRIAIVFIVAGGVGNLIDRVYFQVWDENSIYGVRDMVDLTNLFFEGIGFGVCNFADFFISGGAVALILAFMFFDKDAIVPLGKYKELAKQAEAEREQKAKEDEESKNTQLPKLE